VKELRGGAYTSARGEREGVEDGRRNPKKKTHSAKYAKSPRGPDGPSKEVVAYGWWSSVGRLVHLGQILGGIQMRKWFQISMTFGIWQYIENFYEEI
jgi:hypothetical protein